MSFDKEYWDLNYSDPQSMDGIGNAKEHTKYLKSFFDLELIDISSIIDFGFGYGHLFQTIMKAYKPYKACGIEPSKYAFDKARGRKLRPVESTDLTLLNESLMQWCGRNENTELVFDLGICTSVLQYVPDKELEQIIPILSKRVKYLYLTLPTDKELERQVSDLEFHDTYAIRRTRAFYRKILGESFTNISSKIWESKHFFDEESTLFTELLYRT